MAKNIVKLEMEKMGITENASDNIMSYHGGVDAMLPEGNIPEKIKRCLRKDNWELDIEKFRGGGAIRDYYIIVIKIDRNNIKSVFNNRVDVSYKYPTKYGFMNGMQKIDNVFGNFIQLGKYKLNIDKFEYLEVRHRYKVDYIKEMDD